jgi:hypothetical protein
MLALSRTLAFLAAGSMLALAISPVPAAEEGKARLPLSKVVLFNSGVGFFEHATEIEGDAQVDLKFNVDDINDLLKSMVLEDRGGGRVSTVTYGSKDPITKTLKTFAIDLTTDPTLADLLAQIRGEKVMVDAPNTNPITGTILGVEKRPQPTGKEGQVIEAAYLNLLTEDGLRSVALAGVAHIKLLNQALDAELRQALTILALGHATDKKTVTLKFLGRGKRPVRVGYVQESPIWKTSYRLVLKEGEAPFLQGWAIVENTTEEDWQGVGLTLVSGRPISFVMDLYQPLYVQRPVVEPELFASLRPQTYGQDLAAAEKEFQAKDDAKAAGVIARFGVPAPAAARPEMLGRALAGAQLQRRGIDVQQGVQSAAQASDVGELFQYDIDAPVTLPRQQSAMLPIVNASVQGEKVSIYNAQVHAKHPLNGLKFTNSTGLHLMQGPITVFDGGAYAGDAQIQDLPPNTERLISYAMDLDTEVAPESKGSPDQLVSVKLVKGVLHTSQRYERTQLFTVKNSGERAKNVLIEHPYDPSWTLVAPAKPEEKTRDRYRFAVNAEPGKPAKLEVQEERVASQQVALTNLDDNTIRIYINSQVVGEAVKKALGEVISRKQKLADMAAEKKRLEQQVQVIDQEQGRIRQNMAQLDKNTDLYQRYVKKFGEQEDEVERLRGEILRVAAEEAKARQALDAYLISLTLE